MIPRNRTAVKGILFIIRFTLCKNLLRNSCDKAILILIYLWIFKKALNALVTLIYFVFILNTLLTFRITNMYLGFLLIDLLHWVIIPILPYFFIVVPLHPLLISFIGYISHQTVTVWRFIAICVERFKKENLFFKDMGSSCYLTYTFQLLI